MITRVHLSTPVALSVLIPFALTLAGCGAPPDDGATDAEAADVAEMEMAGPDVVELAFVTHLDMEMPEQDVYIEREEGSDQVFRVTRGDNDMSAPLFGTATTTHHDPFDEAAVGPHPKGEPLGFTLGEWLAHRGTGTYQCVDGVGRLETEFSGLVPNCVYTMWHAFMPSPPTDPFTGTLDLPLGARDGSESVFTADAEGNATYVREFSPCLEMSDTHTAAMLAINYHSDGQTWGPLPGDFGLNAHIPLFVMLPPREGIE